ncbi:hypothetical protein D9756_011305 [Leucocoprinus leucothites]|nr:hypothetical protein D9756_011305 [Leucoagaricus leucothites]
MHFNFLTSLYISVADEGDFKDTYWLMARVSNTVERITLSFRYYASLKPFPKMKNYDLFTFSNLNYLLIEFQANNVGPAYRFLHRFRHGANNLQTLHLVADGTTYPSLGSAIYINKTDWSFFEALQMNPPIFPALKQINLELARNADLRGQATLTLDDFESNLFDLRNDRGIDLTFRHYNYH